MSSTVEYHIRELDIALNHDDPRYCMPEILQSDKTILDIGCGIGQFFIASNLQAEVTAVGVDVDFEVLKYGAGKYEGIYYISSNGDSLPFRNSFFDLVVSRVCLPYTNIPKAISEISRVVRPTGRIWLSLHAFSTERGHLINALFSFKAREFLYRSYVICNGILLHVFGRMIPLKGGKFRSFQTNKRITQLLATNGFGEIHISRQNHFVVTARKVS